jgi:hypothetical protein
MRVDPAFYASQNLEKTVEVATAVAFDQMGAGLGLHPVTAPEKRKFTPQWTALSLFIAQSGSLHLSKVMLQCSLT